ncbi:hypothetical protein [Streptomyces badius]|uniref:hypothetical protein n=1 Tax=Streptomyces badius TaxID=1941 RepID=UPI001F2F8F3F|nr:hypothetical protein [Streptomyces badius]
MFAAHALHRHPDHRAALAADNDPSRFLSGPTPPTRWSRRAVGRWTATAAPVRT